MDFFERLAAQKDQKRGKHKARLTAKWVSLSRIKTPEQEYNMEDALKFLENDKKAAKLIQKNFNDLTVEFDDETDVVSNVSVDEWGCGGLSDDARSIKWMEVTFYLDTDRNVKKDWPEIEDCLRFNFYCDLEIEQAKSYIVFQFADWEDNSVELIKS